MTELPKETDRRPQINEIYQALGQFLVEFSRMVSAMETDLYFAIGGNQHLFWSVTAELTADPLARAWRSVMVQSADLTEDDRKILSGIYGEITDLITLRNDWSHGTWYVGYGESTDDWSRAALQRFKNSSKGLMTPSDLEVLPTAIYIKDVAEHTAFLTRAISDFGANARILRDKRTNKHPSNRIRVTKKDGRRQFQMSSNETDWQCSEMPPRPVSSSQ
jgi:hypothetical protein